MIESYEKKCQRCDGTGKIIIDMLDYTTDTLSTGTANTQEERLCPRCRGSGRVKIFTETKTWAEPVSG